MSNTGPIAAVCSSLLIVALWGGFDPLYLAVGVIGLLCYLAFAGNEAYKKRPPEQRGPWYMD